MATIKISKLTERALNWAVAKCEGWHPQWDEVPEDFFLPDCPECFTHLREFSPSTDRAQGWLIIEREKISTVYRAGGYWLAYTFDGSEFEGIGATPLIAAMRCYVASKLGDTVEVPAELTED